MAPAPKVNETGCVLAQHDRSGNSASRGRAIKAAAPARPQPIINRDAACRRGHRRQRHSGEGAAREVAAEQDKPEHHDVAGEPAEPGIDGATARSGPPRRESRGMEQQKLRRRLERSAAGHMGRCGGEARRRGSPPGRRGPRAPRSARLIRRPVRSEAWRPRRADPAMPVPAGWTWE